MTVDKEAIAASRDKFKPDWEAAIRTGVSTLSFVIIPTMIGANFSIRS